jgi:hypothetical protein
MSEPAIDLQALRQQAVGPGKSVVSLGESAPFQIATRPMDEDWKRRFDEMYPTLDVFPAAREGRVGKAERSRIIERRRILRDGLLGFGGERVCLPAWEDDLEAIIERGQLFDPDGTVLRRGDTNQCHANSAWLWMRLIPVSQVATIASSLISARGRASR